MRRALLFILLLGFVVGCENPIQRPHSAGSFNLSEYYLVPNLSMPARLASQNCGAQAITTACQSLGLFIPQLSDLQLRAWKKQGATAPELLIAARMRGFTAKIQRADWSSMTQAVQSPARALVLFDSTIAFWSPVGWISRPSEQSLYHWAVVAGFARDNSTLLLAAPDGKYYALSRRSFLRRWRRCDNCLMTISLPKLSTSNRRDSWNGRLR